MEPTRHDLTCKAGTTWRKPFVLMTSTTTPEVIDLTGFSARMHVRESIDATTVLVYLATADLVVDTGTTNWGEIEIDAADGRVRLYISDEVTSTFPIGSYVYDVELVSTAGEVDCPMFGKFKVSGEVTRDD